MDQNVIYAKEKVYIYQENEQVGVNYLALGSQLKEMSDRAQSSIDIDLEEEPNDPEPEL